MRHTVREQVQNGALPLGCRAAPFANLGGITAASGAKACKRVECADLNTWRIRPFDHTGPFPDSGADISVIALFAPETPGPFARNDDLVNRTGGGLRDLEWGSSSSGSVDLMAYLSGLAGCGATIWIGKPVNQDKNP